MKSVFFILMFGIITLYGCRVGNISSSVSNWVKPARVVVQDMNFGAYVEQVIQIHNNKNITSLYKIRYVVPTNEFAFLPPQDAANWIIIFEPDVLIKPQQTINTLIAIKMPVNINNIPVNWEFWIGVRDMSTDTLHTEMYQQWKIKMTK